MVEFRDPAHVYSDDDPRQVGTLEPSPVPDYIESGGTRFPNFLGATEEQIELADRETTTTVRARSQLRQGSAAERLVEEVDVSLPESVEDRLTRLAVGGAILAAVLVAINAFARGAGRGAVD